MDVSERYPDDENKTYDVVLDDRVIGFVQSRRVASWRKSGRLRTSMRGRPKLWSFQRREGVDDNRLRGMTKDRDTVERWSRTLRSGYVKKETRKLATLELLEARVEASMLAEELGL